MKSYFKDMIESMQKYRLWLFLLLCIDIFFTLLLWLADISSFLILVDTIFLSSVLFFLILSAYISQKESQAEQAFFSFLKEPSKPNEERLLPLLCKKDYRFIQEIGSLLRESIQQQKELSLQLNDYEEYVEIWAHEMKTPISLLTFLLDNHREEFEPSISYKLDYIQNQLQEYSNQMLYYARLKGTHKDYLFESINLSECCIEAIDNYSPLLEEKNFQILYSFVPISILSDKRGLEFLLNQIISNSIKYCTNQELPQIHFQIEQTKTAILLHIRDNGIGVPTCDLPFLFEKGFTGSTTGTRKAATGMGLYLAHEIANDLNIQLSIQSEWKKWFEITLQFPKLSP